MVRHCVILAVFVWFGSNTIAAQSRFFNAWESRVRATSARQPAWVVPVFSPSAVIVQLARVDFLHQYTSAHAETWSYGGGKGVSLIPFARTQIDLNLPSYIEHNSPTVRDGTSDFSVAAKYRIFAAAEHGNYSTAVQVAFSVPTGSYKNGAAVATITPTFVGGKGFGNLALQSALGAVLPTSSSSSIGRTILWNTVAQYRMGKYLWPEIETNASYFQGGPNNGRSQVFVTPGIIASKIRLRSSAVSRLGLVFGSAMQIATSRYHGYNHNLILTGRITF
jgi:hypothetical protein